MLFPEIGHTYSSVRKSWNISEIIVMKRETERPARFFFFLITE